MHRADGYQGVDELLQADVMRFMAIIAFCLIAILALVRAAETPAALANRPAERLAPVSAAAPEPVRRAEPVEPVPPIEPAVSVDPAPPVETVPPPIEAAAPVETAPPAPEQKAAPPPASAQSEPAPPEERGLSLRFASDQDFLRLLTRGEIRVFAFRDGRVLALGQDLALQPASAPGRLYELVPGTIPELMTSALEAAGGDAEFRWGVALPERVVRAIREHLDAGASGTLVIDRFGEVRLGDA